MSHELTAAESFFINNGWTILWVLGIGIILFGIIGWYLLRRDKR